MQLRRQFEMPETDQRFLESLDLDWETAVNNGARWVFLHGYAIPEGYTPRVSHVAVQVPPGYPDACLDMFYFNPPLARGDGVAIGALSTVTIDGQPWQRWSRHRTSSNPWRPDEDDLSTHILLLDALLERELARTN